MEVKHWKAQMGKLGNSGSDYRNHQRFTLRCLNKDLSPVSVRLKSTVNNKRAKQIIHRAERQLLQDRVKGINGIL